MRAWTDADIIAIAPIDEIMSAFRTGYGVVGNLIGLQSLLRADIRCQGIKRRRQILVRQTEGALFIQALEGRALFDGELVEREMVGGVRKRLA